MKIEKTIQNSSDLYFCTFAAKRSLDDTTNEWTYELEATLFEHNIKLKKNTFIRFSENYSQDDLKNEICGKAYIYVKKMALLLFRLYLSTC